MSVFSLNVWRLHRDDAGAAVALAGVGAQSGAIVWVDFVPGTDHDALAREFAAMQLPGLDQAMLGFLVETVEPDGYGADGVIWCDADVAARLAAGGDVRYLHAVHQPLRLRRRQASSSPIPAFHPTRVPLRTQ